MNRLIVSHGLKLSFGQGRRHFLGIAALMHHHPRGWQALIHQRQMFAITIKNPLPLCQQIRQSPELCQSQGSRDIVEFKIDA